MPPLWTCPFCPLACDHLSVRVSDDATPLALAGGDCPRAARALAAFASRAPPVAPQVDGHDCSLEDALAAAAEHLAASRQPLFAGLATDVAGARALYPLACATGAVCDGDPASMPGLRALQDRGQFTTTLAEVRTRADLIVFVGGLPLAEAPLIGLRLGIGEDLVPQRHIVVLGPAAGDEEVLAAWDGPHVSVQSLPLQDDLFTTLALLAAPSPGTVLAGLAERLARARYAVLVGTAARLPRDGGALIVEAVNTVVGQLNRSTRAAALWIGASTANAVFTWLSGLPLGSRNGPRGLEHDPVAFETRRLLADRAVDALLWVSCFEAREPPPTDLPLIVLGVPALAAAARRPGAVFIPVATPGIGTPGHLFRSDGTVMMPLHAVRDDGLPALAAVAQRLLGALRREAA